VIAAASASKWAWYVARASGVVSLVLLTASVVLGIVTSMRWASERWPRFVTTMLHRNLSLFAVLFLGVHIVTVVADGFAPIRWLDVVVPFASPYRTFWLGLGTVAFDLVGVLVVTSLLRPHIGPRVWRAVHWLAYLCWPVAVLHGLATGTDTTGRVFLVVDAACVVAVVTALLLRIRATADRNARGWLLGTVALAPVLLLVWLQSGPLAPGWAARSGTPASLLAGGAAAGATAAAPASSAPASAAPAPSTAPPASPTLGPSFAASFSGTATRSVGANGAVTLRLDAPVGSSRLEVVLDGADNGSGLLVQRGAATISDTAGTPLFDGALASIDDGTLFLTPSSSSGSSVGLAIRLDQLDQTGGTVRGSVRAISVGGGGGSER
jgi:DMSO/TMAO reductase YedYZ heme-binding membrane subunit